MKKNVVNIIPVWLCHEMTPDNLLLSVATCTDKKTSITIKLTIRASELKNKINC
jgi:hypothetical protein